MESIIETDNQKGIRLCRELLHSFMDGEIKLDHMQKELKQISSKQIPIWDLPEEVSHDLQEVRQ